MSRSARLLRPASLLFGVAFLAGCTPRPDPPIVIVSIDTLRSDHLPAYGYRGVATPAIDDLRRDAILYRQAFSNVPLTLPSHASILSGRLPAEHGLRDNVGYSVDASLSPWLPSLLRQRGYTTGGFVSSFVLRPETGMARDFEVYDAAFLRRGDATIASVGRSGDATLQAARAWLTGLAQRPFLLFVHLYEPHLPYAPPPPFADAYADRPYDGEIAEADRVLGLLVAELKRLRLYDDAIVVVLSDHGEGLGEHGEDEHGLLLYRESLQVPLLVKLPGGERAGESIDRPVQLIDLLPTLAHRVGFPLPPELHGTSLLAAAGKASLYAETYYPQIHFGWQPLQSLISGSHHYIESSAPELYDLAADPSELANRLTDERRLAGQLRDELRPLLRPLRAPSNADEATRRDLAALGYLSGAAVASGDPSHLPRPQDRVGVLRDIAAAMRRIRGGDLPGGVVALEAILAENPLILDAWSELGVAESRRGRVDSALRAYERAFELSGRKPDLAFPVVQAKLSLGRIDEATALATWAQGSGATDGVQQAVIGRRLLRRADVAIGERFLRGSPLPEPQAALAEHVASSGRAVEAAAIAEEVIRRAPLFAEAHEHLALARLAMGQWEAAGRAAGRAVELDEARANAWNHLGVARFQTGDPQGALVAWERATTLDPDLFDALFNLGLKAAEQGRNERAVWALERFLSRAPGARYGADFPRARQVLATVRSAVR